MGARVLIIDDDKDLLSTLRAQLRPLGYDVETAEDGEKGLARALAEDFDIIIVDVMMPNRGGFDVCREIRFHKNNVPLLILSGQNDVMDRVVGLEIGADDYLMKPFHMRELTARVDALLRRANRAAEAVVDEAPQNIDFGSLQIDRLRMKVTREGEVVPLTATEYRLLEVLASEPGRVFTRDELRDAVWGYAASSFEHTVTTTLHRLRSKIEKDAQNPKFIISVRGVGYRFAELTELQGASETAK